MDGFIDQSGKHYKLVVLVFDEFVVGRLVWSMDVNTSGPLSWNKHVEHVQSSS